MNFTFRFSFFFPLRFSPKNNEKEKHVKLFHTQHKKGVNTKKVLKDFSFLHYFIKEHHQHHDEYASMLTSHAGVEHAGVFIHSASFTFRRS